MDKVQDIGNIVLLEHINVDILDPVKAFLFYCDGLGMTRDPFRKGDTSTTWINIGIQQIHLPYVKSSQKVGGLIGLLVPDAKQVMNNLRRLKKRGQIRRNCI